jgi:dTDP-glucose pyrophosphorylase
MKKIEEIKIDKNASLMMAMKQMDLLDKKSLLVFDADKFINIISIGDIQRAILKGESLKLPLKKILRKNTKMAEEKMPIERVKNLMRTYRMELLPIINPDGVLIDVCFWDDLFLKEEIKGSIKLNLPVVIMAGGKGTRLKPLTNVLPKPLIPIGEKTIVEEIMDKFVNVGCHDYYLSVNYKVDTIKHYFKELDNKSYNIDYFQEDKPLGTAGSMFLLKGKITSTFFVSNCDILINQDIEEIYKYHKENNNDITIVSALKHYKIPYGTIVTGNNGVLLEMSEKPEITYQINTGVYILEPHVLNLIPDNKFYHITQLIEDIRSGNGKVGVFPISEGSWKDIGQWDEYLKMIKI